MVVRLISLIRVLRKANKTDSGSCFRLVFSFLVFPKVEAILYRRRLFLEEKHEFLTMMLDAVNISLSAIRSVVGIQSEALFIRYSNRSNIMKTPRSRYLIPAIYRLIMKKQTAPDFQNPER